MNRLASRLIWIIGGLWAGFIFLASNSPTDVQKRAQGWMSLPLIREVPEAVFRTAAHPVTVAASFLIVGVFLGTRLHRWRNARANDPWHALGVDMSLLGFEISDAGPMADVDRLNARIGVIRLKATKAGLAFPEPGGRLRGANELLPYLSHVSAYLKAGEIQHARATANQLAKEFNTPAE